MSEDSFTVPLRQLESSNEGQFQSHRDVSPDANSFPDGCFHSPPPFEGDFIVEGPLISDSTTEQPHDSEPSAGTLNFSSGIPINLSRQECSGNVLSTHQLNAMFDGLSPQKSHLVEAVDSIQYWGTQLPSSSHYTSCITSSHYHKDSTIQPWTHPPGTEMEGLHSVSPHKQWHQQYHSMHQDFEGPLNESGMLQLQSNTNVSDHYDEFERSSTQSLQFSHSKSTCDDPYVQHTQQQLSLRTGSNSVILTDELPRQPIRGGTADNPCCFSGVHRHFPRPSTGGTDTPPRTDYCSQYYYDHIDDEILSSGYASLSSEPTQEFEHVS